MNLVTFRQKLVRAHEVNNSVLCVGFDPEPSKFPGDWKDDPDKIFEFCRRIVNVTKDLVIAFKPQIAHFAANRAEGQLERLITHIHDQAPDVPVILDAKRGDIGTTAEQYAKEVFDRYNADAVTLSPFLGLDTIGPYMVEKYAHKGLILLCKTSNGGSDYLQNQRLHSAGAQRGALVYEHIAITATDPAFDKSGQICLVVGATKPEELQCVREHAPNTTLLLPGIGAQGGDIEATVAAGWHPDGLIVVNSSRDILYGPKGSAPRTLENFAEMARAEALKTRDALNLAIGNTRLKALGDAHLNDPEPYGA